MPSFAALWANHPHVKGEGALLDRAVYADQCAINVSAAMMRAGIGFKSYRGTLSWQKDQPKYPIRAQELADWLSGPVSGFALRIEKYAGKNGFETIAGRTGIVFVQNYRGPGHQGDHIDFWNGVRLTDRLSWARVHLYLSWEGVLSNMRNAEAIWFWPVS